MALTMTTATLLSRPRAGFTWLLVVVVIGAVAFGGVVLHHHSADVARRHSAARALQQLTSYRAPTGFTDVPKTFGCFGDTGQRCFTSVLSPEDAAKSLAASFAYAPAPVTTCKQVTPIFSHRSFEGCEVRGTLGSTRVLAFVDDWKMFLASPPAASAPATAVTMAIVTG
jgi:hypothetical protein